MKDTFGIARSMEPKGTMPVTAWKLDNARAIKSNEARIAIERIHVENTSFHQICNQCDYDESKMIQRFKDIIDKRGKLHNPFTNSGGMVYGKIEEMGEGFASKTEYRIGEEFLCLVTLTAIPLDIENIESIDFDYGQLLVKGYAIIFEDSTGYRNTIGCNIKYTMAALEESGALHGVYNLAEKNMNIGIIGKDTISSMLYGSAIRKAVGDDCNITIVMDHENCFGLPEEKVNSLLKAYADKVVFMDVRDPLESFQQYAEILMDKDLVINGEDKTGTETLCILMCRNNGKVYFTRMSNGYAQAILIAESMKKQVFALDMDQYFYGYDEFTKNLIKNTSGELEKVNQMFLSEPHRQTMSPSTVKYISQVKASQVDDFIYGSNVTENLVNEVLNISKYDCNVIIQGETGVGKEKVLQLIHKNSARNNKPCIKVNCATIQENLAESEFFGYESGAFTGAQAGGKKGYFEVANNGILFLDEIGALSLNMQSKLLRVLQENQFFRVGGTQQININVRVVCANNVSLLKLVDEGKFREDLYYRLNICKINVPPLRERWEDIGVLTESFLNNYNKKYEVNKEINQSAIASLTNYNWPGNVRELENTIHRLVINSVGNVISDFDVESVLNQNVYEEVNCRPGQNGTMDFDRIIEAQEKRLIQLALNKEGSTRKAARALGITQAKLMRKKQKYNLFD